MSLVLSDPPIQTDLIDVVKTPWGKTFYRINSVWEQYFRSRDERLGTAAHTDQSVALTTNQTASIGITPIVSAANVGLYRISSYLQQTVAAGVSASLQVIIRWTSGGITFTKSGAALTGNTTGTYEALSSFMVRVDAGTNITYEVVYASNPVGQAAYIFDILAEAMG